MTESCPSSEEIRQWQSGALPLEQAEQLARHLSSCASCRSALGSVANKQPQAAARRAIANASDDDDDDLAAFHPYLKPGQNPDELGRIAHYRILKIIGEGGMGIVFRAEDPRLERLVALKAMKPDLAKIPVSRQRFLNEVRAVASIRNDHIVTIHHIGEQEGVPYFAMELLEGEPLDEYLSRKGKLPIAEIVRLARETAQGLAAAHERGIIHRDIKPSNLWLEAPGQRVKILDFGLARPAAQAEHLTDPGRFVGTPAYMSPEQARGSEIDPRSDLYSLGCVLYEMAAGQVPLRRQPVSEMLKALASEEPEPLRRHQLDLPPAFEELVHRLLAKQAVDRPQSARRVVEILTAIEKDLAGKSAATASRARAAVAFQPKPSFVRGHRPGFDEETVDLLHRRLKAAALVVCVGLTFSFVNSISWGNNHLMTLRLVVFALAIGTFVLLAGQRRYTLRQLRWWELVVFGPPLVQVTLMPAELIVESARAGDAVTAIAMRTVNHGLWSAMIVGYALLIPNTWQRAALILVPMGFMPLLIDKVLVYRIAEVRADFRLERMPAHWSLLAAPFSIYAVHILRSLRQGDYQGRRLGEYVLQERLGAGDHGEVFRATHMLLRRPCAVKLIPLDPKIDDLNLARFERDVQCTITLAHWNVVEVYDVGRSGDGNLYYVMEEIEGLDAAELVARCGPLPAAQAIHLLQQACSALHEAHRLELIHRNLKPTNLLVTQRGGQTDVLKLVDFGRLKPGDPTYRAPEQLKEDAREDARADIYSLGAVAYFLVTGRPPFVAATPTEIVVAQLRDPVQPPSVLRPDVPADLEQVILRCLQKEPQGRYATPAALGDALASCTTGAAVATM
ncbi:MAG: serine/threonine-protein kinase [Gemmataceae bacterium]